MKAKFEHQLQRMAVKTGILLLMFLNMSEYAQSPDDNPHGPIKWDCQKCHSPASWNVVREPMEFNHDETGFLLAGAHEITDCVDCHQSLRFAEVGTACADCHTDIHRGQFGSDCQNCHTPNRWENREDIFELHAGRGFPLTGVHAVADCQACHINEQRNEFTGTAVNCNGCHLRDFSLTSNPDHRRAGFGLDCESCHQGPAVNWQNTQYEHPAVFELRGAHLKTDCNSCHAAAFAGIPRECVSCHLAEFQNTSNPPHADFGFPTDCRVCHSETRWGDAQFDHIQFSGFELRGAHAAILCTDCHVNNQLTGLPHDCYGCHQSEFAAVADPNHVQGNFPQDCLVCHNENAWRPADFDHDATNFPLTGAHQTINCTDCHINNQYSGTPTDCFTCHQNNYANTNDPNHQAAGFPTTCQDCHNTSRWDDATWDHDGQYFPIFSGEHRNEWDTCADCHVNANNYVVFECIFCHAHTQGEMDDEHDDVANYQYISTACYDCHPNGQEKFGFPKFLDRMRHR